MEIKPVTLSGRLVQLQPFSMGHVGELWSAAEARQTWAYMTERVDSRADFESFMQRRLNDDAQNGGHWLTFTQRDSTTGTAFGTTSICNIDTQHKTMEIGYTWIGPEARGGGRNTEAKALLMRHCFEVLGAFRVQWKTDERNAGALRALDKIGAKREGILRSFNIMPDGHRRNAVFFSVLDHEWPAARAHLESLLGAPLQGALST